MVAALLTTSVLFLASAACGNHSGEGLVAPVGAPSAADPVAPLQPPEPVQEAPAPAGEDDPDSSTPTAAPQPAKLRAVFYGSSTTEGVGASDTAHRWTTLLAGRFGWTEVNRGLSGTTMTEREAADSSAEARWRDAVVAELPDIVVVQYGANDVVAGVPIGAPGESHTFRNAAHVVLGGIQAELPRVALYVVEPQPALALSADRAAYDAALAEAAEHLGLPFITAGEAFSAGEYAADWIHLNDAGHEALAEYIGAAISTQMPNVVSADLVASEQ